MTVNHNLHQYAQTTSQNARWGDCFSSDYAFFCSSSGHFRGLLYGGLVQIAFGVIGHIVQGLRRQISLLPFVFFIFNIYLMCTKSENLKFLKLG